MTLTLQAAGVTRARTWAARIERHRPYPTSDTAFAMLRKQLAKYDPAPATMHRILAALRLP